MESNMLKTLIYFFRRPRVVGVYVNVLCLLVKNMEAKWSGV